jgi:hypothetical protein
LELGAGIFLAACAAAGFGITYLSGFAFTLEERVAFGAVLGAMAVAGASFAFSSLVQDVTVTTVLLGLATALALAAGAVAFARARLLSDLRDARRRWLAPWHSPGHPWPLLAVIIVCGAWTVHFFHQAYVYTPDGLFAGYVNIWGDWAAHLSFASSFAYGHNFPPQYPIDPGHRLGYPFMIDFFAADLVPLGTSLTSALVATSAMLALAFPAVLYLAALRFAGGRGAAAISVFVFLLSGGLGFLLLVRDMLQHGFAIPVHLPREYTLDRDINLQWLNPVLAYLVPQRSTLFGFSLALILLSMLWIALRDRLGWRTFLFAGVVAGVMPVFHVHAYGTVVALPMLWAIAFDRRIQWLAYFVPALVLGVPILVWMWPPENTAICGDLPSLHGYCIEPGWLSFTQMVRDNALLAPWDFIWFWIANLSIFVPLLIVAQVMRGPIRSDSRWFLPVWLWFIVPNLVLLQPWDWDNTKFFVFWALLGSIVVGRLIAYLFTRGPGPAFAAAAMLVLLGLSGALDLARASDYTVSAVEFTDAGGLQVAGWVRTHTSPTAVFAVADEHNSPIPTLAGRRELIGYPGWLWTYGLSDYVQKEADLKVILQGGPTAAALVRQYRIDYVMIGPQEVPRGASRDYWDAHGTLVYDRLGYAVYRVG